MRRDVAASLVVKLLRACCVVVHTCRESLDWEKTKMAKKEAVTEASTENAGQTASKQDLEEAARVLKSKNSKKRERRKAAGVLSVVGASKGGQNRARNLSDEQRSDIARLGGLARQAQARERKSGNLRTKPAPAPQSLNPDAQ